jgi:hypothetical protein
LTQVKEANERIKKDIKEAKQAFTCSKLMIRSDPNIDLPLLLSRLGEAEVIVNGEWGAHLKEPLQPKGRIGYSPVYRLLLEVERMQALSKDRCEKRLR